MHHRRFVHRAAAGARSPGDGQVELTCSGGQCSAAPGRAAACRFEQLAPPGASWDEGFGATCMTKEQTDQLMLSHCLKDVHLASTSGKAGL